MLPEEGRRIDRELEESEARYRTLFVQSPLGVFTYDRDLRLTDCNAAFVRLLQSTYEKLRGLDLRRLRDGRMPPVLERVLAGEPMLYEGEYDATTSSAKVAITMWLTPLRSAEGAVVGGIGIVEDVTIQRAAREAIARSEANFRALVEHAPDAIGVFRGGKHLYVNPKLAEYLGYSREEHFAKPVSELIHPDDHALFRERSAARDRGEVVGPGEYRLMHRDGRTLLADITSINIQYDGGPAVLCFIRDVTERKQMQLRLVQSDRLASVGMLAAGIAHEINNPLAYVMASLEILTRYHLPVLERQLTEQGQREVLQKIGETVRQATDGAERMRRIVRDVKAFARGDDEARGMVDVRQVVEGALQLVSHEIKQRARLVRQFEDVPPISASESRLGQVFLNLLVNALQAMQTPRDHEVRVRTYRAEGGTVAIEVTDTGDGIPSEALPKVFDPFYTTKPVGVGTGLGLFVCHGIVTSMGGTLDVRSVVGQGTTVRVCLPTTEGETGAPSVPRDSPPPPPTRRARLLLVDDEPSLGRAIAAALEDEHDVVAVTSGEAAIELLARDAAFDLILCDLMMPGTTGIAVWETVSRQRPDLGDKFVFVTGGAFTPEAAGFLEQGHPYLEKPFDLRELRAMLRGRIADATATTP
jgi:PAS domain S-box-containing protein